MKILIIGDIFGSPGRKLIHENLKKIREDLEIDLVIANGENASFDGKSLSKKNYLRLCESGIDYFTMGNHTFRNEELKKYIHEIDNMVVPKNVEIFRKGKPFIIIPWKDKKILLMNALGRSFMNLKSKNPFTYCDEILSNNEYDLSILDFHAETTSEKIVLANYLSDKLDVFFGTHTHVQTSDERILNGKTAYITDLGMTGVVDSSIGASFKEVEDFYLEKTISLKIKIEKEGRKEINGILVEIDDKKFKPRSIKRIKYIYK